MPKRPKVLVVGDIMADVWFYGQHKARNPEGAAAVLVGEQRRDDVSLGGAGLVASLLRQLGARVKVMGVIGGDQAGYAVHDLLHDARLGCKELTLTKSGYTTPAKFRFVNDHGIVVFRYDNESPLIVTQRLTASGCFDFMLYTKLVQRADCVVVADYGKGFCYEHETLHIIATAKQLGVPVIVNAKPNRLRHYSGADVVQLNKQEAGEFLILESDEAANLDDPAAMVEEIAKILGARCVVITDGGNGVAFGGQLTGDINVTTMSAPSCTPLIRNAVGAGDALLAGMAAAFMLLPRLRAGTEPLNYDAVSMVMDLAMHVATQFLSVPDQLDEHTLRSLRFERNTALRPENKVLSLSSAIHVRELWADNAERVVFTNGCFDMLHRGHLWLLRQARDAGTRLVVGLNTDESVRKLKGAGRPVQDFETRAGLLAALPQVDLIVPIDEVDFAEHPTLRACVTALAPHVLVKGAEYAEKDIVGWEEITNQDPPGEVWRCPMLDGVSTTQILSQQPQVKSDEQ